MVDVKTLIAGAVLMAGHALCLILWIAGWYAELRRFFLKILVIIVNQDLEK
jgi:hypothetical protein